MAVKTTISKERVIEILAQHDEIAYPENIGFYPSVSVLAKTVGAQKRWAIGQVFVTAVDKDHYIIMKQIAPDSGEMATFSHNGFHDVLTAYRFEQVELETCLHSYLDLPAGLLSKSTAG